MSHVQFEKPATRIDSSIPPLVPGDRLSLREYRRRYENMPHLKKAELIDGVVYTQPLVSTSFHGQQHASIAAWLESYRITTKGTQGAVNATMWLDERNAPQPDVALRLLPELGGQSAVDAEGFLNGPPELIVEVCDSAASYDLHDKKEVYRRNGVCEYVVWRVLDQEIDWFVLRNERYEKLKPDADGIIESSTFPGLWLDVSAMLRDDMKSVFEEVQRTTDGSERVLIVNRRCGQDS